MAPRKFKKWLSSLFTPKGKTRATPAPTGSFSAARDFAVHAPAFTSVLGDQSTMTYFQGSRSTEIQGGLFSNAHNFTIHNTIMVDNSSVTYIQGELNTMTHGMKLLSDHIISGAAHDSSAREPPPRCHPGTRVKLIARITAWFHQQGRQELLLWITGPAGVGKSAVVQTLTEYLVEHKLLGASVFISRPNGRNSPDRIFVTIAYQLAIRIEAYRVFIVDRLAGDPNLVERSMEIQFQTFIVEPFVEKNIEIDGKRWGILLDGLDELEREDAQCDIIRLISTFTLEHPNVPLIWIIASRPVPHISHTFGDEEISRSCWSEHIPIDSSEASRDVEQYLRSGFQAMRKKFRYSVPGDWPSEVDVRKLADAASGSLFYADIVLRRIEDPDRADPVSQLKALLSVIDRSSDPINNNHLNYLDALYHEILSSIPSKLWPAAKRILGFAIYWRQFPYHNPERLNNLRAMSIFLGLTRYTIYTCLSKCNSILSIPDWVVAHIENLTFFHVSFTDYLTDSGKSGDFYVGEAQDVHDDVALSLLNIWNTECNGDGVATVSVESAWDQYCWKHDEAETRIIRTFDTEVFHDVVHFLIRLVIDNLARSCSMHTQLHGIHMINLCYYLDSHDFWDFALALLANCSNDLIDEALARKVGLQCLTFTHLDWEGMSPACAHVEVDDKTSRHVLSRPRSSDELNTFVIELESIRERSPEFQAVIFGAIPKGRVAIFRSPSKKEIESDSDFMYYIIPYPE